MNKIQKQELKKSITKQILETKAEIKRYEELTKPIAPDNAIGRLSRMEAIGAKSIDESILRNLRIKLSELERAEKYSDSEDFGYCIDCDEAIPFRRLQIFPHAKRCVGCKEIYDKNQ